MGDEEDGRNREEDWGEALLVFLFLVVCCLLGCCCFIDLAKLLVTRYVNFTDKIAWKSKDTRRG